MIEINTIGAGGGSIAWIDTGGALKVGPQSAGAIPGPVCYDKGGKEPTVTDANVALGYINPDYFLGGKMKLDKDKAFSSVSQIGKRLGIDPLTAAYGITEIVNANMIRAIRIISVERGYDPRDFVLVAFGGAGPLHACRLAAELNIPKVLIPPAPGVGSAIGLLIADIKHDYSITRIQEMGKFLPSDINKIWAEIEEKAVSRLKKEGVSSQGIMLHRSIDMRYKGQSFEITVPVRGGEITEDAINEITRDFDNAHKRLYGYSCDDLIEGVNFRLSAIGKTPKIRPRRLTTEGGLQGALKYYRKAFFKKYDDYIKTPVYERDLLSPGNVLKGPAIIEQMDSTTVIHPGHVAAVDDHGNIIIEIRED
jgi:N-methylhydantoinase A